MRDGFYLAMYHLFAWCSFASLWYLNCHFAQLSIWFHLGATYLFLRSLSPPFEEAPRYHVTLVTVFLISFEWASLSGTWLRSVSLKSCHLGSSAHPHHHYNSSSLKCCYLQLLITVSNLTAPLYSIVTAGIGCFSMACSLLFQERTMKDWTIFGSQQEKFLMPGLHLFSLLHG